MDLIWIVFFPFYLVLKFPGVGKAANHIPRMESLQESCNGWLCSLSLWISLLITEEEKAGFVSIFNLKSVFLCSFPFLIPKCVCKRRIEKRCVFGGINQVSEERVCDLWGGFGVKWRECYWASRRRRRWRCSICGCRQTGGTGKRLMNQRAGKMEYSSLYVVFMP